MIKEIEILHHLNQLDLNSIESNKLDDLVESTRENKTTANIINNPSNISIFEVDNNQMQYFGIVKGSVVIVDKTIEIKAGKIVLCCVDDEWLIRKLCKRGNSTLLCINESTDACINITSKDINVIGVVTWNCQPYTS